MNNRFKQMQNLSELKRMNAKQKSLQNFFNQPGSRKKSTKSENDDVLVQLNKEQVKIVNMRPNLVDQEVLVNSSSPSQNPNDSY